MQEEKELNNGNDHSRFMPPSIPNDREDITLNSEETTANQEMNNSSKVVKEPAEFTITDIESLATPIYLVTEKVSYTTESTKTETTSDIQEIAEQQESSQEPNLVEQQEVVEQQDYHNKYSSEPYQNYQTVNSIPPTVKQETNVFGIIGLALAVLSWIIVLVPIVAQLTWILGLVFSIIGVFKKPRGLAIAGLVISLIGLIICIYFITTLGILDALKYFF